VTSATTAKVLRLEPVTLTPTQRRVITAAQALFAEHGISGTSLQMIADAIGVTKAAVYHQFKTKEEIILAATTSELLTLQDAMDAAEAEPNRARALDVLLTQVVDRAVTQRKRASLLQNDPVMARMLANHEPFRQLTDRLYRLLTGEDDANTRVRAAMLTSAIGAAVIHPLVADLDDDELRAELLHFSRRLLQVPRH
jgi:AcrR family transcriptional regulator